MQKPCNKQLKPLERRLLRGEILALSCWWLSLLAEAPDRRGRLVPTDGPVVFGPRAAPELLHLRPARGGRLGADVGATRWRRAAGACGSEVG